MAVAQGNEYTCQFAIISCHQSALRFRGLRQDRPLWRPRQLSATWHNSNRCARQANQTKVTRVPMGYYSKKIECRAHRGLTTERLIAGRLWTTLLTPLWFDSRVHSAYALYSYKMRGNKSCSPLCVEGRCVENFLCHAGPVNGRVGVHGSDDDLDL